MEKKRKKLGATPVSVLQEKGNEVARQTGKSDRAGYLSIDKGWNKFRIYPAHPGTESFMYPSVKYYVPKEYDEGSKKYTKKAVFNSKVHGSTEKDIIEEYIKFLTTVQLSGLNGNEMDEVLKPIYSFKGDFNLESQTKWVVYADKYNKDGKKLDFGRLEITNGTKAKIEALIATESSDETIVLEPFTDEEDGIAIILYFDPEAKDVRGKKDLKNFYNVELEEKKIDKFKRQLIPTPLTEIEIEEFLKQESLESMFKNVYKLRDFNLALSGLKIVDEKCKYGVLDNPDFLEIIEEIKSYYPEDEEDEEEEELEQEVDLEDDLSSLDRIELKKLINDEFGQGVIIVYKNHSDDDIREMIRVKRKEVALSTQEELEPEQEPEPEVEENVVEEQEESKLPFEKGKKNDSLSKLQDAKKKLQSKGIKK